MQCIGILSLYRRTHVKRVLLIFFFSLIGKPASNRQSSGVWGMDPDSLHKHFAKWLKKTSQTENCRSSCVGEPYTPCLKIVQINSCAKSVCYDCSMSTQEWGGETFWGTGRFNFAKSRKPCLMVKNSGWHYIWIRKSHFVAMENLDFNAEIQRNWQQIVAWIDERTILNIF